MNGLIFQIRSRNYGKEVEIFTEIPISADAKKRVDDQVKNWLLSYP